MKIIKKQRNKVNRLCRNAKRKNLNDDCKKCNGDSKKIWKVINRATGKIQKTNTYPNYIETKNAEGNTVKVKDKSEIANAMNKQFTEMGDKLAADLQPTSACFSDYLKSPSKTSMFLAEATDSEVEKHFSEINVNKGVGIDENPPKILKWGSEIYVPIITKLFKYYLLLLSLLINVLQLVCILTS